MKHQQHILSAQFRVAADIWEQIRNSPEPADRWLAGYFFKHRKKVGSRDRRLYSETIYSCFRHMLYLEQWLGSCPQAQTAFAFTACAAAREGLIGSEDFRALAVRSPASSALRTIPYADLREGKLPSHCHFSSAEEEFSLRYSFPLWLVQRCIRRFGEVECEEFLRVCQLRPPLTVRANTLKISRDDLLAIFRDQGYTVKQTPRSSSGILFEERVALFDSEEFRNGFFEVQDEGSQILCETMHPAAGSILWDACAGGGGKSLALAALMRNKGRIIATDIRSWKLQDLKKRARRAGAFNIFPADLERMEEIGVMKDGADTILVDAPCSGTGTLRRNPDARWKLREEQFPARREEQLCILESVLPRLKSGGTLWYATCSLEPEENEEVAGGFLRAHPEMDSMSLGDSDGFLRLLPHRDGTDGFFLAAFRKRV